MDVREKLVELLNDCVYENVQLDDGYVGFDVNTHKIADELIQKGVTVQERGYIKTYSGAFYPYSCSKCGNCHAKKVNFCSNCGTKLDLPQPSKGEQ